MNKTLNKITNIITTLSFSETVNKSFFSSDLLFVANLKQNSGLIEKRIKLITESVNNISCPTFCNGLEGVGWFFQYLIKKEVIDKEDFSELLQQIDKVTYNSVLNFIKFNNHDFLHGATGNAIYLLDRILDNKDVKDYLTVILKELRKKTKEVFIGKKVLFIQKINSDKFEFISWIIQ
jgi:hypothetical protein